MYNLFIYLWYPPIYPRLSSKSPLQDYVGHWDWGVCLQIVPFVRMLKYAKLDY